MAALDNILSALNLYPKWKAMTESPDKIANLEKRIAELEKKLSGSYNQCPFCKEFELALVDIKPDSMFGPLGKNRRYYKCNHCHKAYDELEPDV